MSVFEYILVIREEEKPKWIVAGFASTATFLITQPLELLKIQLQTQQSQKVKMTQLLTKTVTENGVWALYQGISASILRQFTYATTRFYIYEHCLRKRNQTMADRIKTAAFASSIAAFVGLPTDKVRIRMQNDPKLPQKMRKNYEHAFDGLWKIYKSEGLKFLFAGATVTCFRAAISPTIQLYCYPHFKQILTSRNVFEDELRTHLVACISAVGVSTTVTHPLDVIKTRMIIAESDQFLTIREVVNYTAQDGFFSFYKGYIPAMIRLVPHTILLFVLYEQLNLLSGIKRNTRKV